MSVQKPTIPSVITGSGKPGHYGYSAAAESQSLLIQAAQYAKESGNGEPLAILADTPVRYCAADTFQGLKGNTAAELIKNAASPAEKQKIGAIKQDLVGMGRFQIDNLTPDSWHAEGADDEKKRLGVDDLVEKFSENDISIQADTFATDNPFTPEPIRLLTEQRKNTAKANLHPIAQAVIHAIDMPDKNGELDGKITENEIAAQIAFNDNPLAGYKAHRREYKAEFARNTPIPAFLLDWFMRLQIFAAKYINPRRKPEERAMTFDGQIAPAEQTIAGLLRSLAPRTVQQTIAKLYHQLDLQNVKLDSVVGGDVSSGDDIDRLVDALADALGPIHDGVTEEPEKTDKFKKSDAPDGEETTDAAASEQASLRKDESAAEGAAPVQDDAEETTGAPEDESRPAPGDGAEGKDSIAPEGTGTPEGRSDKSGEEKPDAE